jgi:hypothetical protein
MVRQDFLFLVLLIMGLYFLNREIGHHWKH